jgi:hypothetical protein
MSADQEAKRNCIFWMIVGPVLAALCLVQVFLRTDKALRVLDALQLAAWTSTTVFHVRWFRLIRKRERLAKS